MVCCDAQVCWMERGGWLRLTSCWRAGAFGGPFAVVAPAWVFGWDEQPPKGMGGGGGSREKFAESGLVVRRRVCRMAVHSLASPTQMPRNVGLHTGV